MSWSTIIATSAGEFAYWTSVKDNQSFHGLVIYLAIPFILVCINAFSIEVRRYTLKARRRGFNTIRQVYRQTYRYTGSWKL